VAAVLRGGGAVEREERKGGAREMQELEGGFIGEEGRGGGTAEAVAGVGGGWRH
jgi:hypothetical protein